MKRNIKIFIIPVILCALSFNGWSQADTNQASGEDISKYKVYVPYGAQDKEDVTSAVSTISGEELIKGDVSNFANTLYGKLPGLFVYQGSGEPGEDVPTLRIRGASKDALILIDGYERDMTFISPEEVESVSVMKDAAALAIYGMKGANGVILITTKRGIDQAGKISVSVQSGLQAAQNTMEVLGAADYMSYYNMAAVADGLPEKYSADDIAAAGTSPRYPDVNWSDLVLREYTNITKANVNFRGGSEYVRYFVNVGGLYNNGIFEPENPDMNANNNLMRMNVRSNIDVNFTKTTLFSLDLAGIINKRVYPADPSERIWTSILTLPPNEMNPVNPDGSYGGTSIHPHNPLGMLETTGRNTGVNSTLNSTFRLRQNFDFIAKGLSAGVGYVIDNNANNEDGNWRYFAVRQIVPGSGDDYSYYTYREDDPYTNWNNASSKRYTSLDADINYNVPEFNGNKVDVMIRYQHDRQFRKNSDIIPYLNNNIGARLNYAYKGKYLLELSGSYFGSDQYESGSQYGFFPAASAGWVFSNEDFLNSGDILSYGKLRGSYGITGRDRFVNGRYPYIQFYENGGNFPIGNDWNWFYGLRPDMLANPDIKWEVSNKLNIGVELTLFDKVSFEADYFVDNRTDVLYIDYNHAGYTGATLPYENIGELTDTGFDLTLGYTSNGPDLTWYTDFTFSYYDNTINEMGEALNTGDMEHLNKTGNSVNAIYGLETIGYFESDTDIESSPTQTFGTPRVGDLKYKDQNNDDVIDSRDRVVIGNSSANIDLGLRFGLKWNDFDFETFLQGRLNNDIDLSDNIMAQPFIHGNAVNEIVKESDFPTLTLSNMNNYQSSSYWIRNGNFLKVRNIEIGYTLPENTLSRFNVEKLRVFVKGVNALTLSKWKYTDPEYTGIGYPPMKSFLLGVNVNF